MKKVSLLCLLFFVALVVTHNLTLNNFLLEYEEEGYEEEEHEKKTDEPEKFFLFHRGIRTAAGENSPAYAADYKWTEFENARNNARKRSAGARTKDNGVIEWKERGPANVPGRTRALLNIPGDPNNNAWLAGSATGGIWRTTDGGSSWTEKSGGFPALPISSFACDANASVIYAGTGEYVSSLYSSIGNGIFKSTDKGLSWSQLPSTATTVDPEFSIVTRVIVDPLNPSIIVATTVPHNLTQDNTSSIMRSTNGGVSWTKVKEVEGFFEQIVATPGNFSIQYASQNGTGVWKSTNGGVTWNLSNAGMTTTGRVEIAVSPVNPNIVFASAEGTLSGKNSDLYQSSNGGATWSILDVKFSNAVVDFFEGQGFYDNTIMCDPFTENIVYFGGVSLFRSTVRTSTSTVDNFQFKEINTKPFLFLQSFTGIAYENERLTVGSPQPDFDVEVRFGPGLSQKAHRFHVPNGKTSGILVNEYTYVSYVDVPFQVWDVTTNRQLMVSWRDQNRNGTFDLLQPYLTADGVDFLLNSREYLYIHNVAYNATTPSSSIDQAGGQEVNLAYNIFPALSEGATWTPGSLPLSTLEINRFTLSKINTTTVTVADGRGSFDNKNKSNQVNLHQGVHPDHHFMIPAITSQSAKTFKIILGNDGGVFVSKSSATPGITEGDWLFKGNGYNTSQFYGADKKPGADEYIGGMQDNGTRFSPAGESADATSEYVYGIGGDGFEVIWNSRNPDKILGSVYNGQISRSLNGGTSWSDAVVGLTPGNEFSFVTKLANSKNFPERVFTVGTQGVYVSPDFGGSWQLTPVTSKFVIGSPLFLDVEVSRANANIVWAGSGMNNTGTLRNLHVSANGGKTFTATNNFTLAPLGNLTKLASHPTDENTAYALFSFAHHPKIIRTTDRGVTWTDISGFGAGSSSTNGFPDVAVFCLYVRADNPDIIWAGTEIGIVESLDNGQTWALIDAFPNVAVWDMKGQDDQVVIATHGRGIWTATLSESQEISPGAEIIASGTSPQQKLMLRIKSTEFYDSIQIFVGTGLIKRSYNVNPGLLDVSLNNIPSGQKEIKLVSFKGSWPFQSMIHKVNHLLILPPENSYTTYFSSIEGLTLDGLSLQNFTNASPQHRRVLMTNHNYSLNKNYPVLIRTPVAVATSPAMLYYSDIAIVEPGNDSIVVEATKNGLDWTVLSPPHDASFSGDTEGKWLTAYTNHTPGTVDMFVKHEVSITDKFSAGDILLFRLRMVSGPALTSWGWAIDYISIQELPVALESPSLNKTLALYPNPSKGNFSMEYVLNGSSTVTLAITDIFGRTIQQKNLGLKSAGFNSEQIDLNDQRTGTYVVILDTREGKKIGKVSVLK